jgi:hypothetical protein
MEVLEHVLNLVAFAKTEESVVDKDASEPVSDGFVEKQGHHAGIDPTRKAKDDFVIVTNLFFDGFETAVEVRSHGPVSGGFTDVKKEALQDRLTMHGVPNFGVILEAEKRSCAVLNHGVGGAFRRGIDHKVFGKSGHTVPVTHPDLGPFKGEITG